MIESIREGFINWERRRWVRRIVFYEDRSLGDRRCGYFLVIDFSRDKGYKSSY